MEFIFESIVQHSEYYWMNLTSVCMQIFCEEKRSVGAFKPRSQRSHLNVKSIILAHMHIHEGKRAIFFFLFEEHDIDDDDVSLYTCSTIRSTVRSISYFSGK